MMLQPALIIAAPSSGSGKTTITAGLIAALKRRGMCVAPFKVGPDYIDPTYHTAAAGRTCHNLDAWMLNEAALRKLYERRTRDADLAVIEGVMGLFDGIAGHDDTGSTAHIARLLGAAVVLVIDARAMARTAAAIVHGLSSFDPQVNVAGVIFNRVGSPAHAAMLREAVEQHTTVRVLGSMMRDETLSLPERHLGLIPTAERNAAEWVAAARAAVEASVDLDALSALISSRPQLAFPLDSADSRPLTKPPRRPVVAIARDEAFSFFYPDNLELLEEAGAELAFFSPMRDAQLPKDCAALVLCGGFPELYAAQLAGNATMRSAIARAAAHGMPIYAECGGLMYLCEALVDGSGAVHPMCGVLPGLSAMTPRLTMGYRLARALQDNWLWRAGETIRGHEFHYSTWQAPANPPLPAYELLPTHYQREPRYDGAQRHNVIASYLHVHFLAMPVLAERLVWAAYRFSELQPETRITSIR